MTYRTLAHYEILAKLGEGGMGVVYKARDTHLDRIAAVKVLPEGKVVNARQRSRFVQEAKSASALNHPNIITIYDIAQDHGVDFIAMEYVEGEPLDRLIPPSGMEQTEVLRHAAQIADALAAAHGRHIVHRDLKPANIMVCPSGMVKILDFGLAKLYEPPATGEDGATITAGALTEDGTIVGTASYMSPEQAEGKPLDGRSDIFSFGAVLYEMLTGRKAFAGDSRISVLAAILREDPRPLGDGVPSEVGRIVGQCLAKDRSERFADAGELRRVLERQKSVGHNVESDRPSIAVMPFANLSGDKDNEYFGDGLAEEIINALTALPGLRVLARTSAFAFRGKDVDVRELAAKLAVTHVLEGSVRSSGNRIRVTAQLISAEDGYHLWSERFDRELEDIFTIQDEISQAIADRLLTHLSVKAPPVKRHTQNVDAYRAYLMGRHHFERLTPQELDKAERCYNRAIAHDPEYALGYVGLGSSHYARAAVGLAVPRGSLAIARAMLQRALELDVHLAEAHSTLGGVNAMEEFGWQDATAEFQKALELEPDKPLIRFRYAYFVLRPHKRFEEALHELDRALEQDPLSLMCGWAKAAVYGAAQRHEEAVEECRKALEIEPNLYIAQWHLAVALMSLDRLNEANLALEQAERLGGKNPEMIGLRAGLLALEGRTDKVQATVEKLTRLSNEIFVSANPFVFAYMAMGDMDSAFLWADKAVRERSFRIVDHPSWPGFAALRSNPRYPALLKSMNLAPETLG